MTRTQGSAGAADYTRDALRDFGTRGIALTGHAYAWCERGAHFHIANARDVDDVRDTISRIRHGKVRLTWRDRSAQPKRDVYRVAPTVADTMAHTSPAQRYAERFEAQRYYGTDATPSALPSPARKHHNVTPVPSRYVSQLGKRCASPTCGVTHTHASA